MNVLLSYYFQINLSRGKCCCTNTCSLQHSWALNCNPILKNSLNTNSTLTHTVNFYHFIFRVYEELKSPKYGMRIIFFANFDKLADFNNHAKPDCNLRDDAFNVRSALAQLWRAWLDEGLYHLLLLASIIGNLSDHNFVGTLGQKLWNVKYSRYSMFAAFMSHLNNNATFPKESSVIIA